MCVDTRVLKDRCLVDDPAWQLWGLLAKFGIGVASPELLETVIKAHWDVLADLAHKIHRK